MATEIADLDALIEARPARAGTLRHVSEELRAREANLKRVARRKVQAKLAGQVPAGEAYRAAVAEMCGVVPAAWPPGLNQVMLCVGAPEIDGRFDDRSILQRQAEPTTMLMIFEVRREF